MVMLRYVIGCGIISDVAVCLFFFSMDKELIKSKLGSTSLTKRVTAKHCNYESRVPLK